MAPWESIGGLGGLRFDDVPEGHPVREAALVWYRLADRAMPPTWQSFQPDALVRCLSWMLVMREQEGGRLKYVIAGEDCNRLFNSQYQGAFLGKDLPEFATRERYNEVSRIKVDPKCTFSKIKLPNRDREFIFVYRGLFPFSKEIGKIDTFMVVIAPLSERV